MQLSLNIPANIPRSAYDYGQRSSGETHGVVLTKPHAVSLILDLAGYTADRDLGAMTLLEPSCGRGAFLIPAVRRLLEAAKREGRLVSTLSDAVLAFDIDPEHVADTKRSLVELLRDHEVPIGAASRLVDAWIVEGDFLLASISRVFDFVVGNPPYVRIEQIDPALQSEYRQRYQSIYDRADLYVAFIERGLSLLSRQGVLSFVCADRWVLNKYGAALRDFISADFGVQCYVDLHAASPFESDVVAYPSIFVLSRAKTKRVAVVTLTECSPEECASVVPAIRGERQLARPIMVTTHDSWFEGDEPWILSSPAQLDALRSLESRLLPIEATAHIGIGVATGNDGVYIVNGDLDVEPDRLVPLVIRDDIERGRINNGGHFVINTFSDDGGVVDLEKYPKLAKYLHDNIALIKKRHVAKKNPGSWFRTIDRVYPKLVTTPKLLIPDIAGSNEIVFDEGHYHPHHNLYFATSEHWDMKVLGGLLSSRVALFFVWSYAVKMRGGYLRFQAQYLRRIRLPDPKAISLKLADAIRAAFRNHDFARLDELALDAYGIQELPEFDFVDTRR